MSTNNEGNKTLNDLVQGKLDALLGQPNAKPQAGKAKPAKAPMHDHGMVRKPGAPVRDALLDDSVEAMHDGAEKDVVLATVGGKKTRRLDEAEVDEIMHETMLAIGKVWDERKIVWTPTGWMRMRITIKGVVEDVLANLAKGVDGRGLVELEIERNTSETGGQ